MSVSIFELFSIGIGPSSSHTVGPMLAAKMFLQDIDRKGLLNKVAAIKVDLYGALALTGKGHGTDMAVILGLAGESPDTIDVTAVDDMLQKIRLDRSLELLGQQKVPFQEHKHLVFQTHRSLPYHPNGMRFAIYDSENEELDIQIYYSLGGGFVVDHESATQDKVHSDDPLVPFPFATGEQLLEICEKQNLTVAEVMLANEETWRSKEDVKRGVLRIWRVMQECVRTGCHTEGILPGGLNVKRRAPAIYKSVLEQGEDPNDPALVMDWVSLWALAVNEENAAGGRIVTAPTNGAAGIIPAVLHYYERFTENADDDGVITFLLTAAAIGSLYKAGASISAAEMGCQGEVGVACSMAAAGLVAALGGNTSQIENAAEIGMEHNLGLTCDPVKGLVQVPCIERNTMGSIKAINAGRLAMRGDGDHKVSLDQVINTMQQVGRDMNSIYKETSKGGLAVNVIVC